VDGKSQIQALQRAQPILPMDFGQPERRTHNHGRHGTLDPFAALNVATGEVLARCKGQHRAQDFVAFLREIEASVEPGLDNHVVLDNLSAHRAPPPCSAGCCVIHASVFISRRRTRRGSTWWSGSWIADGESAHARIDTSIPQLRGAILAYVDADNERGTPFKWVKTADEILDSMRRFGLRVQQVHGNDVDLS